MQPSSLPLVRVGGRWTVAIGRARVDVADGSLAKTEARQVARRVIGAGLVRGLLLAPTDPPPPFLLGSERSRESTPLGIGPKIPVSQPHRARVHAPSSCGGCLDCLSCELAEMRGRGRRHAAR
jgi:hypothetical protein